ncbi:hypothetical protein EGW08_002742 [Elysia chlorotica]|uniref:Receptor ligand binding region domain-containing protein n=1 Tax=Elysia chlorotica TaxID=188477 RepID=A0A3S1BR32_ELYCH|nr:hypothetical protein EGW08_002742 [Elysia chlorotica]
MKTRKFRASSVPRIPSTTLFILVAAFVLSLAQDDHFFDKASVGVLPDQSVDRALDTGQVSGLVPLRTLAINPGTRRPVNVLLLVPYNNSIPWAYRKIMPALEIALQRIDADQVLPNHYLRMRYFDSKCDDSHSMNYAINAYMDKKGDAFFGPCCDYALAPVSRQATFWQVPLLTVGAEAPDFLTFKFQKFRTLTRAGPKNLQDVSDFLIMMIKSFHFTKMSIVSLVFVTTL